MTSGQDQWWSQETYDSCSEESEDNHDSGIPEDFAFMNKPLHHGSTITYCTAILKYCHQIISLTKLCG